MICQSQSITKAILKSLFLPRIGCHFLGLGLMYQSIPKPPTPPAIPGHLTRVKLPTVGNLTQNEARSVGHLTFASKRLSAVRNKRLLQFFDSAREPRSCQFHVGFSVVVILYSYIVEYAFV